MRYRTCNLKKRARERRVWRSRTQRSVLLDAVAIVPMVLDEVFSYKRLRASVRSMDCPASPLRRESDKDRRRFLKKKKRMSSRSARINHLPCGFVRQRRKISQKTNPSAYISAALNDSKFCMLIDSSKISGAM